MVCVVKVSKKQKQEIDYKIQVINGFFDQFVTHTDTSKIYLTWKLENVRIGDVISYIIKSIDDKPT